jgi:hypothetical protein
VVKRNNLTYDVIGKDVVRFLKRKISQAFKSKDIIKDAGGDLEHYLLAVLDVLLYCYSTSISASTTFKVAQVIVLVCKYFEQCPNGTMKHTIYSKIAQDVDHIFTCTQRKTGSNANIKTLNILKTKKKLGKDYALTEERIKDLFALNVEETYDKLNYFQIITLLYYIEDNADYLEIKVNIEKSIVGRYKKDENLFAHTELFLLFFDIICCPFISVKVKCDLIRRATHYSQDNKINAMRKKISSMKKWFVDWNTDIDLERILKTKEWGDSY